MGWAVSTQEVSAGDVIIARLHGEACWDCGAVGSPLVPAGDVTVRGSEATWPIKRCVTGHSDTSGAQL
ncbi:hypothetical protein CP968_06505 [Streptomyces subrutilus]|nr:hypothetical protein CP968_06505 [Streptomyces subrutilus]